MLKYLVYNLKVFVLKKILWRLRGECQIRRLEKKSGLRVGRNLNMQAGVIIDPNYYPHITIGENVSIGARVQIYAHDGSIEKHLGYTRIGKTNIGNNVFLGAGSIILPGINIGNNSIVGAGSVVTKDIPANVVVAGNPAQILCSLEDFLKHHLKQMKILPRFGEEYSLRKNATNIMRQEMNKKMSKAGKKIGYVLDPLIFKQLRELSSSNNINSSNEG